MDCLNQTTLKKEVNRKHAVKKYLNFFSFPFIEIGVKIIVFDWQ